MASNILPAILRPHRSAVILDPTGEVAEYMLDYHDIAVQAHEVHAQSFLFGLL